MEYHFTKHAQEKFLLVKKAGFTVTKKCIKQTIKKPLRLEDRNDGTQIASSLLDDKHVLRIVFRREYDTIIVITFYPGRRKAYAI